MRYAILAAALAAGAVAVPYNKRDVVTDVEVVYQTAYVTVTAGQEPAPEATTVTTAQHYGHHYHDWSSSAYVAPPKPTSTYVEPAPEPSSTYVAPAPATTEAAHPSSAAATTAAAPTGYAGKVITHHNLHRANHSAAALEWSDSLASTAAKIAASCVYAHNTNMDGGGYGQNIAAGVKSDEVTSVITDLFYNGEVGYYDGLYGQAQPDMTNFKSWGHFSQIVWKKTTSVGCHTQDCSGQGLVDGNGLSMKDVPPYFTVCNYDSPGNFAGEYGVNVGESLLQATIDAAFDS